MPCLFIGPTRYWQTAVADRIRSKANQSLTKAIPVINYTATFLDPPQYIWSNCWQHSNQYGSYIYNISWQWTSTGITIQMLPFPQISIKTRILFLRLLATSEAGLARSALSGEKRRSDRFRQLMINAPATDKSKEPSACWTTRFDCDTGRFTLIWWINSWILSCQASLRCRFLNKLENNAQNPDQRTSVTVSLRVVSTCWPWPSCCPTRIAAVLRVTWWLGLAWKCWDTQEKTSFCPMSTWSQAWHVRCLLHVQTARSQGSRRHHDDSWLGTFGNPS